MLWKSDAFIWDKKTKTDGKSKARKLISQGFSGLHRPAGSILGCPPQSSMPRTREAHRAWQRATELPPNADSGPHFLQTFSLAIPDS